MKIDLVRDRSVSRPLDRCEDYFDYIGMRGLFPIPYKDAITKKYFRL